MHGIVYFTIIKAGGVKRWRMKIIVVIPIFYMIKFFEDGPGLSALPASISTYLLWICIAAVVIFLLSIAISLWGYSKK